MRYTTTILLPPTTLFATTYSDTSIGFGDLRITMEGIGNLAAASRKCKSRVNKTLQIWKAENEKCEKKKVKREK
jgi:hypothetical protein